MNSRNTEVKSTIDGNRLVFTALRRSDIAHQFKQCMIEKGIRSRDVAERLGVSEANVSRWLSGTQNMSIDTLYAISDALEERLVIRLEAAEVEVDLICIDDDAPWTKDYAGNDSSQLDPKFSHELAVA